MYIISGCLLGFPCKHDGTDNGCEWVKEFAAFNDYVAVCPEVYGNLGIPRIPCEKRGDRVYNTRGEDKTGNYVKGALKALEICRQNGCRLAELKAKSPSCGVNGIYDGTFTHTLIEDDGIFAKMLKDEGVVCLRETDDLKEIEGYL
jgi:uncharacterized protein YbbK (DUF523 family)